MPHDHTADVDAHDLRGGSLRQRPPAPLPVCGACAGWAVLWFGSASAVALHSQTLDPETNHRSSDQHTPHSTVGATVAPGTPDAGGLSSWADGSSTVGFSAMSDRAVHRPLFAAADCVPDGACPPRSHPRHERVLPEGRLDEHALDQYPLVAKRRTDAA